MFAVASPAAAVMRSGTVDRYTGENIVLAEARARSIAGGVGSLCLVLPALPSTDEVLRCADIVGGSSGRGRVKGSIDAAPERLNMNYNLEALIVTIPMMIAMVAMINDVRIEFDNSTPMAAGPTTCPRLYQVVKRSAPPFIP